jgi:SAM-dependent methyltransferase
MMYQRLAMPSVVGGIFTDIISRMIFSNFGYCPICEQNTEFSATHEWLRDFYLCNRCGTAPRQRAVVEVLNTVEPRWRKMLIHESSPCIPFFAKQCAGYTCSYYLEDVALGSEKRGQRCENLEQLTFSDATFDVFLTQDVLEHVLRPDVAVREIARVLRPGGVHIFTAPKHKHLLKSYPRARLASTGEIEHLLTPEYHGNPIGDGRSLVTWDYGADFEDLLATWSGYLVSDYVIRDRARGIDGEYLDVFVMCKDGANRVPRFTKKDGGPVWNIEAVGNTDRAWERKSFELSTRQELVMSGWAVDQESNKVAGGVEVVIDDTPYQAEVGGSRPDVASFLGNPDCADCGYVLRLPPGRFVAGPHTFFVRVFTNDRQSYWEAGPYALNVK